MPSVWELILHVENLLKVKKPKLFDMFENEWSERKAVVQVFVDWLQVIDYSPILAITPINISHIISSCLNWNSTPQKNLSLFLTGRPISDNWVGKNVRFKHSTNPLKQCIVFPQIPQSIVCKQNTTNPWKLQSLSTLF